MPRGLKISFTLNGKRLTANAASGTTLLDLLRNDMGLRGTKEGCRVGYCGACTVLVDDKAVHSCCVLTVQINGRSIETIESTAPDVEALREAFVLHNAVQCGVCIPGMIMTCTAALRNKSGSQKALETQVHDLLTGNICRCGGYSRIKTAALDVLAAKRA